MLTCSSEEKVQPPPLLFFFWNACSANQARMSRGSPSVSEHDAAPKYPPNKCHQHNGSSGFLQEKALVPAFALQDDSRLFTPLGCSAVERSRTQTWSGEQKAKNALVACVVPNWVNPFLINILIKYHQLSSISMS